MGCPKCGHDEYVSLSFSLLAQPGTVGFAYRLTHLSLPVALSSAVFFQDQSKRKQTRMILFYVCTKCDHAFTDPSLDLEQQPEM